jgi:excisionase family DNA binding protein
MTTMTLTKAKRELTTKIADSLSQSLKGSGAVAPRAFAALDTASRAIVEDLLTDRESVVALTALLEAAAVVSEAGGDPWLKTEGAAKKMGFSRPYVAALIDAGEFGAGASKTGNGHRRVKASAVEKWLRDHEVSPERMAQARSSNTMEEFFEVPKISAEESAELARRIEQARGESMNHRPVRKRP